MDKSNESDQNSKNVKEMPYPLQKEGFKKKRKQYYISKEKCPNFTDSFIQTYQMRKKELKMKLEQFQEEVSKASLPVSTNLGNDFKSIILEFDQRKIYPS